MIVSHVAGSWQPGENVMLPWPQTNTARRPPSESFKSTFGGEGLWILFYIEFSFSLGTLDFLLMTSCIKHIITTSSKSTPR